MNVMKERSPHINIHKSNWFIDNTVHLFDTWTEFNTKVNSPSLDESRRDYVLNNKQ